MSRLARSRHRSMSRRLECASMRHSCCTASGYIRRTAVSFAWLPSCPPSNHHPFASTLRGVRRSMSAVTTLIFSEVPCSKSSTCFMPAVSIPMATTTQISRVCPTPSINTLIRSTSRSGRLRSSSSCSRFFFAHILNAALLLAALPVARSTPRTGRPWATEATVCSNKFRELDAGS
jgi:hypothetical protein